MLNNITRSGFTFLRLCIFKNLFIYYVFFFTTLSCSLIFAEEIEGNTTIASGGDQIIVSPLNILLDLGESDYVDVLVLDKVGNPVEGRNIQIVVPDKTTISISSNSVITNESGYVQFSILGKQQGDTVITVSDGVTSTHINIAIRNLIHYVLPYFYGNMELSLINPSQNISYGKIQFHENSDRSLPPVVIRLEGKEMRALKLSEELDVTLEGGWVEIESTEIMFGGVWTNKGYASLQKSK